MMSNFLKRHVGRRHLPRPNEVVCLLLMCFVPFYILNIAEEVERILTNQ